MAHPESGDPTNYPNSVTLPDDGDDFDAASFNIPFEALLDRTAWLKQHIVDASDPSTPFTDTSATEWTAGVNDQRVELRGYGGGGGGGGGCPGNSTTDTFSSGGGAGGASLARTEVVEVTPGVVYEILAGSAGAGGAGATPGNFPTDGGDGGDTIFRRKSDGVVLARFKGATGGKRGTAIVSTSNYRISAGGSPTSQFRPNPSQNWAAADASFCYGPGFGGDGVTSHIGTTPRAGASSTAGNAGGAAGANGTNASYAGGGAGGGGAAGPGGGGRAGRDGGNGVNSGTGGNAAAPAGGGLANSGAGGGGGGGGGSGPSGGGSGSAGTDGSEGKLTLRPVL